MRSSHQSPVRTLTVLRTLVRALLPMCLPLAFAAAQQPTASLRGTVADSIRHGPLAGATVVIARTTDSAGDSHDYSTTTDAHGKYAINTVAPGTYVLTVEHPWLDTTGLSVPAKSVDLTHQRAATVNLAVPSGPTIRAAFCPIAARDSSMGLVAGYVKDVRSDHPVAGARVVFTWSDFDVDPRTAQATPRERTAVASTGRDGTFRLCGLPVQRTMLMQAQFGDHEATGAVEVEVPTSGVLVESLRLNAGDVGTTSVVGKVTREDNERAVAGARVHLYGGQNEVVTSADGSFHLSGVPLGTQSIEVTALGFYPRRLSLEARSAETSKVTIGMLEMPTVLDSVKVLGTRAGALTLYREFDERSAHGIGQYITEEMIAKQNPRLTSDLMQQVRGFYVMSDTVYSSRGITRIPRFMGDTVNRVCRPSIYIDGNHISAANQALTLNAVQPAAIHGIEVYASSAEVPAKYLVGNCGAIFIWTK